MFARLAQLVLSQARRGKIANRLAQGAVPVLVEAVPQLFCHRADAEQVDIGEIQLRLGIEIFIAQIAPADDRHAVIGQPELVVHAPVLAREIEQPPHRPGHARAAPQLQRVEQADLDIGMGRKGCQHIVQAITGRVIEQDAHPYSAIGRLEQLVDQHARTQPVVDDVVLQVEAGLRVADQLGPGPERFAAVGQQAKPRAALIRCGLGLD